MQRDFRTRDYTLTSFYNGLAYKLINRKLSRSVFVQGDDAAQLRLDMEKIEHDDPGLLSNQALDKLWNDFEYGLLSEPIQQD